jgi:16S rRNA (guanine527-N7)-methyltransferase
MAVNLLTQEQELLLRHYAVLLHEQNKTVNLVGWKTLEDLWNEGVLFSVAAFRNLPIAPSGRCADVGAGAGIVGIPLAILFPKTEVVLIESNSRKISWLNRIISELHLTNTRALCLRAEVCGKDERYREQFHWVFSRALASMSVVHELTVPLVRLGGFTVHIKTPEAKSEFLPSLQALNALGAIPRWIVQFGGAHSGRSGALFVFQKKVPTPPRYPRKPGIPQKRPLRTGAPLSRVLSPDPQPSDPAARAFPFYFYR